MEIDEVAARVFRSYWALLLVMTVLPLVLVGLAMSGQDPPAVAKSRLQASSKATDAAPGDAGVSIVVSQVKAFATSRNLLDEVLRQQRVRRSPEKVAKAIGVTGLGTSTVVELSVKDADAAVATRLTDAIGTAVVAEINQSNQGSITKQIGDIDKRVRELERRLGPLSRRAGAQPNPDIGAANERERVQAELTDLRSNRSDLRAQLSAAGTASIVQPAVLAPESNPVVMMSAVAGLVGLIGGILIAVVTEMVRPTIPGQRRVAERLGVPLLGWADQGPAELADLGRRLRLSAKREGVGQVTLVGAPGPLPPALVSSVAAAVYGDGTKVVATRPGRKKPPGGGEPAKNGKGKGGKGGAGETGDGPPLNSGGSGSRSVVRAGAAVMTKQSGEAVSPTDVTQPVPYRTLCHVHAFEDIDPGLEESIGVVAVVGPVTLVSGLESVRDLVAASGWPLLGVIAVSRKTVTSRKSRG
ncbi:hypothetical protein [Actinomadura rubrisoli]|uniref:Polysaccharide chain length determinant N-terminal domain-containing protein n=1 Tax=Actinomadura rubrisoli TaxID=2530368 RepID=A0A4R5B622_9ACTN|nr:hypothetical protein [Actinomadura rubrisoli]TDD80299.1 hypothetical protein E1298_26075 [Actinomadura rubrisoli]